MLLGEFHKLLADNRDNKKITERSFIGLLVDVAHYSHNSEIIDFTHKISGDEAERLKDHYRTSMAYPYSVSDSRPPIPLLKERAILYQIEERFWDVCSFILNEIDDEQKLRDILSEVINKDNLFILKENDIFKEYTYIDCISENTDAHSNLKLIYTVFIVDYYYYIISRNFLLSSILDFDNLFSGTLKFKLRGIFDNKSLETFMSSDSNYGLFSEWNKTVEYVEELKKITEPLCELPPPTLINQHFCHILFEFDINDFNVKMYKNKIIIKKALKPGIYRIIQRNAQDGVFQFKDYIADEKNDKLYAVTEDSILEIDLKNIGWENTGKILKTGKTPDYILHPISKEIITAPYYSCKNSKKLIYYTYMEGIGSNKEEIISNKKATITKTIIDPLADETSKSTLIKFEEPIPIEDFKFHVSPDEKFILLHGSVVILIRLSDDSKEMEVLLEPHFKKPDKALQKIHLVSYHKYNVKEISFNNNGHLTFSYDSIDNGSEKFDKDLSDMR